MNILSDVVTYVRRIIKSPSNAEITDDLIIDYINRFWINDVDARIQLFDLKTTYAFQTVPGVDRYNMPLYDLQVEQGNQGINSYPVYQGFMDPCYVDGVSVYFESERRNFFNTFPNITQAAPVIAIGNGTSGPYTITFPISPFNTHPANTPVNALIRGHVDISGIIASGANQDPIFGNTLNFNISSTSISPAVYFNALDQYGNPLTLQDSGQFLQDLSGNNQRNIGLLMVPGTAPNGYTAAPGGYDVTFVITGATNATQVVLTATTSFQPGQRVEVTGVGGMTQLNGNFYTVVANGVTTLTLNVDSTGFGVYTSGGNVSSLQNVINYLTGTAYNIYFSAPVAAGTNINGQCLFFQSGLPRGILYYNNIITLRNVPDQQYLIELDAYLSPAAFLTTAAALQFGYMSEYIARGAARKILTDTGDVEQFQFYEPLFREQEILVWKRSQRQFTSTRTQTIYSQGMQQGSSGYAGQGGNAF